MNVNPGELNKKIKFITKTNGEDGEGFPIEGEIIRRECWAKVTNTSGTEVIKSNAEFAEVNTRFLIRHTNTELTEDMTLVFNKREYDISYMNDYGFSHEYVEVFAKARR